MESARCSSGSSGQDAALLVRYELRVLFLEGVGNVPEEDQA
jgi:hypothetical protein